MAKPWEKYADPTGITPPATAPAPWEKYAEAGEDTPPDEASPLDQPTVTAIDEYQEEPGVVDLIRHVAGGAPQAAFDVMDLPSAVGTFYAGTNDFLFGEEGILPLPPQVRNIGGSLRLAQLLSEGRFSELPGVAQVKEALAKETVTREQAPIADALRTSLEWGAGGFVRGAQRAAGKAVSAAPDLIMGASAGLGSLIGGETGELVGGVAGLLLALRTGDFSKLTKEQQNALEVITQNAEDPQRALRNLQEALEKNEVGTLADLTRDPRIYDIESATSQAVPNLGSKLTTRAAERARNTAGRVSEQVGGEAPALAEETAQAAVRARQARISEAARGARREAETAAETAIEGSTDLQRAAEQVAEEAGQQAEQLTNLTTMRPRAPSAISREFTERIDALDAMLKDELTTPAWEAFKTGPRVQTAPIKKAVNDYLDTLVKEERGELSRVYGRLLKQVDAWDASAEPQSIQAILSQMKDATRNASAAGAYGSSETFLSRIIDEIDSALEQSNDLFRAAKEATRERIARTGGEGVAKVRRTVEPEKVIRTLGLTDENGAVMLRRLEDINDPQAKRLIGEQLRALARKEGIDENFLAKYNDILDGFPEMRNQMREVVRVNQEALERAGDAEKAIREQTKFRNQQQKALDRQRQQLINRADRLSKATERSLLGQYANAPKSTIQKLLRNPDSAPQLTRLYRALRRQGGGEGFRGAVREGLLSEFADPRTGEITGAAFKKFDKARDNLVAADILTGREADEIGIILARQAGSEALRKNAIATALDKPMTELNRLLASGAAAATMGVTPGGQSLILAGAVRRAFMTAMKRRIGERELQGLEDFILNPQKYLAAAREAETIPAAVDRIMTKILAGGQVGASINEAGAE